MSNDQVKIALPVKKLDEDRQFFYAWATVITNEDGSSYVDSQGDIINLDELQRTAHSFISKYRRGKVMHEGEPDKIEFVESVVVTPDLRKALGMPDGPTGWLLGGYVKDPDTWQQVKNGQLAALSIGGTGKRKQV